MVKKGKSVVKRRVLRINKIIPSLFWFFIGFVFAGIFLISLFLIYFKYLYKERVIPGVYIGNIYVGEKTKEEIESAFNEKNSLIGDDTLTLYLNDNIATYSAKNLDVGYDTNLIVNQSLSLGKQKDIVSNL